MHNSTFVLEGHHHHQELPLSLKRETTEEMSKMFTTLYDNEDPQQLQQLQQQQQLQQDLSQLLQQQPDAKLFADSLASPWIEGFGAGPASPESCFSASSSSYSESAQSSPKTMDADETDALIDMFRITIEDLLAGNPLSALQQQLQCPEGGVIDYTSDFALFAPPSTPTTTTTQQQQFITAAGGAALQFENTFGSSTLEQQQYPQSMHRPLGPHRSGSLSPVMSCAPYPATQQHHHSHNHHHHHRHSSSVSSHSSSRFSPHSPEQQHFEMMMPHSPLNTYALPPTPSPSTTPCMSPMSPSVTSFETTTTTLPQVNNAHVLTSLPSSTEDITVVKNGDGSIMVYNRQTESMTFRCELCPNESFGRIHDLKRHQASKHQDITWPCEFCHRPFVRRDALLRHYTVKASREDGVHPASHETELLMAARARAKLIC
jgi:hypothetical protein